MTNCMRSTLSGEMEAKAILKNGKFKQKDLEALTERGKYIEEKDGKQSVFALVRWNC